MSWQTIVKEHNLAISVINSSNLVARIDAEYYDPKYIENIKKITSKGWKPLKSLSKKITDFGAYSQNSWIEYLDEGKYIFIRNQDIEGFFIKTGDKIYITEEVYKKLSLHLEELDILIQRAGTLGKASIVLGEDLPSTANQNLAQIKIDKKLISPFYIIAFLNSHYGISSFERLATGNVQPWLNLEQINNLPIPIPSSLFQEKISEIIASAKKVSDDSRTGYIQAEQWLLKEINLEGYKGSSENISVRNFKDCLVDDRFDAEYWQPDFDAIQNAIKKHKDGFGTLNNLFVLSDKKTAIELEKEYLYAELADVDSVMGTVENFSALKGKELPSRGRMMLKKDDIIVSSLDGSLNKIAIVSSDEKNIIGSTGFFVLRQNEYEPEVALVLLKSDPIQKLLKRQGQGTILSAIPKSSLSRVVLPKINKDTQKQIKQIIIKSHEERQKAKDLIEKAKRAVEIFIEQDEKVAQDYLSKN